MNDHDLQQFKQLLLLQRQELNKVEKMSRQSTRPVDLDQSSVGRLSRMDAMQSQAVALESRRHQAKQLARISTALKRS